jgi:hypothetical protein
MLESGGTTVKYVAQLLQPFTLALIALLDYLFVRRLRAEPPVG